MSVEITPGAREHLRRLTPASLPLENSMPKKEAVEELLEVLAELVHAYGASGTAGPKDVGTRAFVYTTEGRHMGEPTLKVSVLMTSQLHCERWIRGQKDVLTAPDLVYDVVTTEWLGARRMVNGEETREPALDTLARFIADGLTNPPPAAPALQDLIT